jgi:hypothetical protein
MAKSESSQTSEKKPAEKSTGEPAPQAAQRSQVSIDDTQAVVAYANFCRVTGTPEELILDCGLNSNPAGADATSIKVTQRLVMNYYTAKRLLSALQMSVQRHEGAFGVLETDVQKRITPSALRQLAERQEAKQPSS